ncbi:hypothetical protein [Vibrio hippocampi]|uniref:Uncharacterized protein n=1 Tax=Vibrio hippocampi TaxID=654686 RepID=A0ABN8DFY8_9VIBR|nr:hypothetical protein [Vibrio hippocampi]CAH0525420.1 hypothetical protein VHP8226_00966 [Vibrio hippocampi]
MNNPFAITLRSKTDLSPVTLEQLRISTYFVNANLKELHESNLISGNGLPFIESIESRNLTPKLIQEIESSHTWVYVQALWTYAETGVISENLTSFHMEDVISALTQWICAILPMCEYQGEYALDPVLKVVIKALARMKLEFGVDFESGGDVEAIPSIQGELITLSSGWWSQVALKHLTVLELALLAGIKNINTVRNAQYVKEKPLEVIKEDGGVFISVEVAREWLAGRRGFVALKS